MPLHAFIAFGLFLKIPGYATVMLRNRKQAQCILKLLLGATNTNRSSSSSSVATSSSVLGTSGLLNQTKDEDYSLSLSTMPFQSLRDLLNDASVSSDREFKLNLATFIFDNRILTLILSILSNLSHHPHRQTQPHFAQKMIPDNYLQSSAGGIGFGGEMIAGAAGGQPNMNAGGVGGFLASAGMGGLGVSGAGGSSEDKNSLYWAKGTGFGTGSTMQQWDAEKTLMQQKMEEEHVSCILEILSSYIECFDDENIKDSIVELFDHSCVINALASYLRNDSGNYTLLIILFFN